MGDITKIKVDGEPESSYQLYPRNEEFAKRAGGNAGSQSGVQPDWNQNDDTKPDYIKNRPFYTGDPVKTVLVKESTIAFSDEGGVYAGVVISTFSATVGNTYMVYWDGAVYESVCVDYRSGATAIGNLSIAGAGADTGEPFFIAPVGSSIYIYTKDTSASLHTISISAFARELVKIDAKYLPMSTDDSYGIVKKSDIVTAYNFRNQVPHDQMVEAITAFETGSASIVWDGKKVIGAYYDSSTDTISVTFAQAPLRLNTYKNEDGVYIKTLGAETYGELQGSKVRIVNDDTVYATLSVAGESGNETLRVNASRISINGPAYGISTTEIILKSSTANSTKKFKITVDDSGALTATEVT